MEEIDIIELLKRVKEGKAPKEIQIEGYTYYWHTDVTHHNSYFRYGTVGVIELATDYNTFELINTKIKILDKPIIEELKVEEGHTDLSGLPYTVYPTKDEIIEKINEIIKHINNN